MSLSFSMLRTAEAAPTAKKPRTDSNAPAVAAAPSTPQPVAASPPARAISTSAGAALSSLAEAKRQMQAARDAKIASEAALHPSKPKQQPSSASAQKRPTTPPSASSLLSLRLARESALDAKRALEHRLGSILWVEFGKQALAIDFLRSQSQQAQQDDGTDAAAAERETNSGSDLKLFAFELPPRKRADGRSVHTGARRFIVTTYSDFWVRYFTFAPALRHHYELILEGAPCHLYFDIEFKWKHNPQLRPATTTAVASGAAASQAVDVEAVMRALCDELVDVLNSCFGAATLGASVTNVLQLDSASSSKFSRHLIVRLCGPVAAAPAAAASSSAKKQGAAWPPPPSPPPRFMFRDNAHAGRFVRFFCQHVAKCTMKHAATTTRADAVEPMATDAVLPAANDASTSAATAASSDASTLQREERIRLLHYITVREPADSSPAIAAAAASVAAPPLFQTTSMIDPSVYTRNRSFRLFLSSKNTPPTLVPVTPTNMEDALPTPPHHHPQLELEPAPVLLVADCNQHPLTGLQLRDIFLDSLVCNVQCPWSELQLLSFSETDQASIESAAAHALLPGGAIDGHDASASSTTNANGKRVRAASRSSSSASSGGSWSRSRFHPGPSPFPRLEQFLSKHLHERVPEAKIRGWTYFKEQNHAASSSSSASSTIVRHTVSFTVDSSYRWCGNVGRMHRSNGVYFILDLLTAQMSQRCWDPSCKYYSSPPIDIPRWIVEMDTTDQDDGEGEGDDEAEAEAEEKAMQAAVNRSTAKSNPSAMSAHPASTAPPSLLDDDEWDLDALDALEAKALAKPVAL